MPLLIMMMLLLGSFAALWGFLACFYPARFRRLVDLLSLVLIGVRFPPRPNF